LVNFKEFNNELNFYNSDFIFRFLTKNNFWLKTEVFNASVLATYKNSTYNLKNIDGSFYFDSKTGSKTTINGFLENEKLDFNIDSKMVFNSNLSNWLTLNINFLEKNKIVSKISVNGDQKQKSGKYILNFSKISKYHYKLLKPLIFKNFANFELEKGKLDCAFNISTNETNINEIKCENFLAQNICIGFLDKKCFLKNATGTFSAFYTNFQKWDFQKINSKISISDLLIETSVFPKILAKNAKIDVLNGQIQEASISLESKGVFTKIDFSGFLDNIETKGVASGNIKNLFELANKEFDGKFENYDFSSEFRLINRSDELKLTGKLNVLETLENFTFSIDFSKFFNKQLLKNIHSGWIRAENVDLEKYSIFFPQIKPVKGCATFALFYNDKSIFLRLKGKDFSFNPNYMKINIPFVGDGDSFSFEEGKEIICNYDLKKQKLFVSYDGFLSLALPNLHLSFDVNSFQLSKKKNEKFDFKLPNVVSENLKLDGNVSFGIFEKDLNLDILVNKAKGDISCLSVMLKNLFPDYCRGGVKGYIKGEKDVFYLSMPLKKGSIDNIKWGLNCDFSKLDVSLSNNAKLKDVSTHFEWCSKCSVFFVEQFLGDFYLGENKKYHLSCPYIVKDENE